MSRSVCELCHTGILVFQQTGKVRAPHARIYRCSYCGTQTVRDLVTDEDVTHG